MNFKYRPAPEAAISDILARDPGASLHDIRHSHSAFRGMSLDHLGLRLGQALDRRRASRPE